MEILQIMLPYFLFCLSIVATTEDLCRGAFKCSADDNPLIQFPFHDNSVNPGQCSYPGFDISCNKQYRAVIQIGSSGEFLLREVNYLTQELLINDPYKCLPERLLNFDLSGTPFWGAHYENFTFFNCSSEFSPGILKPISCLSTLNHTIFATSSNTTAKQLSSSCNLISSVMVPSKTGRRTDINKDLHLIWYVPDCRSCTYDIGYCGFKDRETKEINCFPHFSPATRGLSRGKKYAIGFGVGIPILIGILLITCCFARRFKSSSSNNQGETKDHT